MIFSQLGSKLISLIEKENLENQVDMEYDEEGASIFGFDVNPAFTEYVVFMEVNDDGKSSKIKKASLGYVKEANLEDFDVFDLPDQIQTIKFIADKDFLLAEGNQTFYVFETRNDELARGIRSQISSSIRSDADTEKFESSVENSNAQKFIVEFGC